MLFSVGSDTFSATGKWVPTDATQKPIPSETKFDCFKRNMSCVEGTAEYYFDKPHILLTYYDVIKWDSDGIIARSSSGICMTNTVLVSFAEKQMSAIDSMKVLSAEKKKACNFFGAVETENWRFIIFGSSEWDKQEYGIGEK